MKKQKKNVESMPGGHVLYEIHDGKRYLFDVMPSENPREVLESTRGRSLRLIEIRNGNRVEIDRFEPRYVPEEEQFGEYTEDEDEA